jgi:hypothetical protein
MNTSTFVLLTAIRNILLFDDSTNRIHSCFSMATLNGFTLPRATCMSQYKRVALIPYHSKDGYTNAPQRYIIRKPFLVLLFLPRSSTLRQPQLAAIPNNLCNLSVTSGCNYVICAQDQYAEQNSD